MKNYLCIKDFRNLKKGRVYGAEEVPMIWDEDRRKFHFRKTRRMTDKQKNNLLCAWQWCDDHDKSTEFMLQFMSDMSGVEYGEVCDYMASDQSTKDRKEWHELSLEDKIESISQYNQRIQELIEGAERAEAEGGDFWIESSNPPEPETQCKIHTISGDVDAKGVGWYDGEKWWYWEPGTTVRFGLKDGHVTHYKPLYTRKADIIDEIEFEEE